LGGTRFVAAISVAIGLWGGLGEGAAAQEPARPVAEVARERYRKGMALYNLMRYEEAASEFAEAYTIKPDPLLLYNMAQAYRLADQPEKAVGFYKSYLRNLPDAANAEEVRKHIERLKRLIDQKKAVQAAPAPTALPPPVEPAQPLTASPPPSAVPPVPAVATPVTPPAHPPAPAAAVAGSEPARDDVQSKPGWYERWWFWTGVAAVVAGGVLTGVVLSQRGAQGPSGTLGDRDFRGR